MRFHCPKCDTKYRIAEDKLAAKPSAKMRCKECATVFSVQEAIAAEVLRSNNQGGERERSPAEIRPSVPVPTLDDSPRPVTAVPATAAAPRLPLPARTLNRPLSEGAATTSTAASGKLPVPTQPFGSPGAGGPLPAPPEIMGPPRPQATAPGKGLSNRGAPGPRPLGRRGLPADTVSIGLPERSTPGGPVPPIGVAPGAVLLGPGLGSVGPVLGRGSAAAFPPVTAERTLPAVPPLPPRSGGAPDSVNSLLSLQPFESQGPAASLLGSQTPSSNVGPTPRIVGLTAESETASPFSSGPWSSNVDPRPALDGTETLEVAVTPPSPSQAPAAGFGDAVSGDGRFQSRAPASAATLAGVRSGAEVVGYPTIDSVPMTGSKGGVSRRFAGIFGLALGALGFGSGYFIGSSQTSAPAAAVADAAAAPLVENRRVNAPPPPPPPELGDLGSPPVAADPVAATPPGEEPKTRTTERRRDGNAAEAASDSPASQLDSLGGLSMATGGGPVVGAAESRSGGGAGLEAAAIQSTVQKNQNAVKRSCWQPALNGRSAGAPSTARVTTTLTIAPSGAVTSVKHSGDPRGYPGLGGCIAQRLKGWTFPRSSGTTTANIPFVFAAQ